jgi:hypothetical protein
MAFVDTSGTRLAVVAEATYGTTPSSPSFVNLRYTGESLKRNKKTVTSNEITGHYNVTDVTPVGYDASGNVNFELSYATLDTVFATLFGGAWSSNVLKNGTTKTGLTFEKTFEAGSTDIYRRFPGCLINTLSLNMPAQDQITGSFSVMGLSASAASAALSGATYTAANTKAVMNTSTGFASLTVGSVSPAVRIRSMQLEFNRNVRQQTEVGSAALAGLAFGDFEVTGTMEVYLSDIAILNAVDNHTASSITFTVGTVSSEKYTFYLPTVYLTDGDGMADAKNRDVMVTVPFRAIYNTAGSPAFNATARITRAVA